jgi:hypothetical protein
MKWGREIDYHGSRDYGAGEPNAGLFSTIFAWLAKLVGRKSDQGAARHLPSRVVQNDPRQFALVVSKGGKPPRRQADCPFPIKSDPRIDRHDRRLLP